MDRDSYRRRKRNNSTFTIPNDQAITLIRDRNYLICRTAQPMKELIRYKFQEICQLQGGQSTLLTDDSDAFAVTFNGEVKYSKFCHIE